MGVKSLDSCRVGCNHNIIISVNIHHISYCRQEIKILSREKCLHCPTYKSRSKNTTLPVSSADNVGHDLYPNCLTLCGIHEITFRKSQFLSEKKNQQMANGMKDWLLLVLNINVAYITRG